MGKQALKIQPAAARERPFDKYWYYLNSVQSPKEDMEFLDEVYREVRGTKTGPKAFREDFCGTFLNCVEWIKMGPNRVAHGVDLDPEPLTYGRQHHLPNLDKAQQKRLHLHQSDVLGKDMPMVDAIAALNFSYFIFKERATLKKYLKNCHRTLNEGGVLLMDCFGGSNAYEPNEEETEFDKPETFSYFWDQDSFDPLTNQGMFYIHFKRPGEPKRKKVFTYDWRMWTVAEMKDLLLECGFTDVKLYWEGSEEDGTGDGDFKIVQQGEPCEGWICYIAALK